MASLTQVQWLRHFGCGSIHSLYLPLSLSMLNYVQLDDELESDLYLDAIVAVVDAKHILQHLDEKKAKVWACISSLPIYFPY